MAYRNYSPKARELDVKETRIGNIGISGLMGEQLRQVLNMGL